MGGYHANSAALDENICQWVNKQVMLKLILILCGCLIIIDCLFNLQYTGIITKHKTIIVCTKHSVCTHTYDHYIVCMSTVLMLCPLFDFYHICHHHWPHTSPHWGELYRYIDIVQQASPRP